MRLIRSRRRRQAAKPLLPPLRVSGDRVAFPERWREAPDEGCAGGASPADEPHPNPSPASATGARPRPMQSPGIHVIIPRKARPWKDSPRKVDKRSLTERDICTKFILPAVTRAGWDAMRQVREEVYFTNGRIIVRGRLVTRGKAKKADFVLYYKPNLPIALIEAKDNGDPDTLLAELARAEAETAGLRDQLKAILAEALAR